MKVITEDHFTGKQWNDLVPTNMQFMVSDDRLYIVSGSNVYVFYLEEDKIRQVIRANAGLDTFAISSTDTTTPHLIGFNFTLGSL